MGQFALRRARRKLLTDLALTGIHYLLLMFESASPFRFGTGT